MKEIEEIWTLLLSLEMKAHNFPVLLEVQRKLQELNAKVVTLAQEKKDKVELEN